MSDGITTTPDWKILLIGGVSGVGKTMVAQEIAHQQQCSVLSTDDLRMAMLQITSSETHPTLHFLENIDIKTCHMADLVQGLIDVAAIVSEGLVAIIDHHCHLSSVTGRLVIEGDGILPMLIHTLPDVRGVILQESSFDALFENMLQRKRGPFTSNSPWWDESQQKTLASMSWQFGEWLASEAQRHGVPVVMSRPWENLGERVSQAILVE